VGGCDGSGGKSRRASLPERASQMGVAAAKPEETGNAEEIEEPGTHAEILHLQLKCSNGFFWSE
jgi:hypothetical protein